MERPKFYVYLPIVFSLVLILGILIGSTFKTSGGVGIIPVSSSNKYNKLEEILRYINQEYVDTVQEEKLVEKAIVSMLENLDPHSAYIPAEELQANNEPLKGHFEGIGIEFNIVKDTIFVVSAIPGGPAEGVGIMAGDKIVQVEGKSVAGIKITNQGVMDKLKGPGGTKVKVGILRRGKTKPLNFTITRGTIPIYSIDVAYMVAPTVGYIKISRFAATTYDEYISAFDKLKRKGMKKLIVDLRGNGGGFLNTAVDIADEFLSNGKGIVYTEGKARSRQDYKATGRGFFEKGDLVILIDDGSASASEILAGAIQDNDRGTIVGRRSFGKGLVQEQSEFSDGSGMRLTIARYYTPTGRCIQKPYDDGAEAYYQEEGMRFKNGELESADSIKTNDSLKYKTPGGKIVYGGGGITPDVFVPLDTSGHTPYLALVSYSGLINDFAFDYADKNRKQLKAYKSFEVFNREFDVDKNLFSAFVSYAEKNKVPKNAKQINKSETLIKLQLKALIARNIWNNEGFYPVILSNDNVLKKAIELAE